VVAGASSPALAGPTTCPAISAGSGPFTKPSNPEALRQFETGNRAYKSVMDRTRVRGDAERERELDRAIEAYRAGAAIEDVSAFDFNLGQAYRVRGHSREAVEHLQRFLDCASPGMDPATRTSVEKKI